MTEDRSLTLSEIITDMVVFWERGRVIYTLALVGATVLAASTLSVPSVSVGNYPWGLLLLLAVVANVLYTSGYLPDFLMQHTPRQLAPYAVGALGVRDRSIVLAGLACRHTHEHRLDPDLAI